MLKKLQNIAIKVLDKPLYFWLLVFFVYVIARVATWGYPFDSDHWIFYYVGRIWAQGGTMYVAAWDHKPPLIFVFNGLMYAMFGGNLVWHRIWLTLLSIVDIALFWQFTKRIFPSIFSLSSRPSLKASGEIFQSAKEDSSSKVGMTTGAVMTKASADLATKVSLVLYVFWRNLSQFTSSGNNTENYGLIFFLGMMLSYISFRKDQKWWKMLLSGACFSMLFFLKGNFLLLGVPIGILLLVDNWKSIRKFFGYGIVFCIPLALQAGIWGYYFQSRGALNDFFVASFQFSAKYAKSAWAGDVSNNIVLLLSLLVFLLPVLMFFAVYLKDVRKNLHNHDYLLVGLMFVAGLGLTLGVGSFYPYYFLITMPIYVIVMTYALFNLETLNEYLRLFIYSVFGASIAFSLLISMKQLYNTFSGSVRAEAQQYQDIADYVKSHTSPTDKVFAYDYGASFYRLAERDSGSRFISASVLLLENRDNYGFHFDDTFISDMEKSQAKYVVVYTDRDTLYYGNKPVVKYFDTHYHAEKEIGKFTILVRN
jgi:hypothetical protein